MALRFNNLQELYDTLPQATRDKMPQELWERVNKKEEKKGKKSKHNNVKVTVDGMTFDSGIECERWFQLVLIQREGEARPVREKDIRQLNRQVSFKLHSGISMRIDATYMEYRNGVWVDVAEDAKGQVLPEWKNKAKMFRELYPHWVLKIYTRENGEELFTRKENRQ